MSQKIKYESESKKYIIGDLIFSFSPIFFLTFIRIITKTWENILKRSDWSFLAMVLFGQTIVKLVQGILKNKNKQQVGNIILFIISLLMFGFVPPTLFLVLIEMQKGNWIIYILQIIWIIMATIAYFVIGSAGSIIAENKINKDDFSSQ